MFDTMKLDKRVAIAAALVVVLSIFVYAAVSPPTKDTVNNWLGYLNARIVAGEASTGETFESVLEVKNPIELYRPDVFDVVEDSAGGVKFYKVTVPLHGSFAVESNYFELDFSDLKVPENDQLHGIYHFEYKGTTLGWDPEFIVSRRHDLVGEEGTVLDCSYGQIPHSSRQWAEYALDPDTVRQQRCDDDSFNIGDILIFDIVAPQQNIENEKGDNLAVFGFRVKPKGHDYYPK